MHLQLNCRQDSLEITKIPLLSERDFCAYFYLSPHRTSVSKVSSQKIRLATSDVGLNAIDHDVVTNARLGCERSRHTIRIGALVNQNVVVLSLGILPLFEAVFILLSDLLAVLVIEK